MSYLSTFFAQNCLLDINAGSENDLVDSTRALAADAAAGGGGVDAAVGGRGVDAAGNEGGDAAGRGGAEKRAGDTTYIMTIGFLGRSSCVKGWGGSPSVHHDEHLIALS